MQFKDLSARCMIDMEHISKNDQRMFYVKPNSMFLEDPEQQRVFRTKFLKDLTKMKDVLSDGKFDLTDQFDAEVKETMVTNSL